MVIRWTITCLLVFLINNSYSQSWIEKTRRALPQNDELTEVEAYKPSKSEYLFYSDSCDLFEKVVCSYFSKIRNWKKYKIQKSSILTALCKHSLFGFSFKKAKKTARHHSYLRRLNKALIGSNRTYAYIEFAAFEIPVVQVPSKYFYDTENGDSPYHLYEGKKPTEKEIEEDEAKYKPCKILTEDEIAHKIEIKIRTSKLYSYILKKEIYTFGVGCIPKKRTVYRKGIPTIRVFIVVGIKRINEKKIGTGKYKSKLRRQERKTIKELEKISRVLRANRPQPV